MRMGSRFGRSAAVIGMVGAGVVALTAVPAQAATTASSDCSARAYGPMCFYYHSSYTGARAAIVPAVDDLYSYLFSNTGDGHGKAVANNAGSGINDDRTCAAILYEHVNGTGRYIVLSRNGHTGDRSTTLGIINNNDRSMRWDCS
jgi:hypothetical protein